MSSMSRFDSAVAGDGRSIWPCPVPPAGVVSVWPRWALATPGLQKLAVLNFEATDRPHRNVDELVNHHPRLCVL
jgi:hypothetical protein